MNKGIQNFVEKYNNTLIPAKYKFEMLDSGYYSWFTETTYTSLEVRLNVVEDDFLEMFIVKRQLKPDLLTKIANWFIPTAVSLKDIINNDNEILQNLAENIDKVNDLRAKWRNSKPEDRKAAYAEYKEALKIMNDEYKKASALTIENQKSFKNLVERKDIATDKVLKMMEKRAKHSGIKQLKANVDAEISDRDGGYNSSTKEIQPDKKVKSDILSFKIPNQTRKDIQEDIDYYTNREFAYVNRNNGENPGESKGYFTRNSIKEILENENSDSAVINKIKDVLDNDDDNEDIMIVPERSIDITLKDMAYRGRVGEPAFKINGEKFYKGIHDYSNDSLRERLVALTRKEILDFLYN